MTIYRERKTASMQRLGIPADAEITSPDDHYQGRPAGPTNHRDPACGHCGLIPTPEGYDGCIGHIPGVENACCGHGRPREAYLQDGSGLRVGSPDMDSTAEFEQNAQHRSEIANRVTRIAP